MDLIEERELGLEEALENGKNLSGGQRQRYPLEELYEGCQYIIYR